MTAQPLNVGTSVPQRLEIPFTNIQRDRRIAAGSCGPVYAGILTDTNEAVAIKELLEALEVCRKECSKHMLLHHRNIIRLCGLSENPQKDRTYIITELAPRGSLTDALKSHPQRNDWAMLVRWALDIVNGLQYLHSLTPPMLHLDLKPQNVLLFDDGTAKLCDFGISHIVKHTVTRQTVAQFSPHYAAPEQFAQAPISAATDIYALGGVLFAMITKTEPRGGLTLLQIAGMLAAGTALSLPDPLPTGCPRRLADIARRCFQLDPKRRSTISRVINDLTQVYNDPSNQQPPRIVSQQFAREPLPPDGWLSSYSLPRCSLQEILNRFEGCPAPDGRTDLSRWEKPTLPAIAEEYKRVETFIPRSNFISDRDHEDAMAVGLYTDESFVYWLMNAWANDTSAERERGLSHVGPFMWRLAEALPRCCDRYSDPAVRILKARADCPQVMRDAFDDYEHQLAEGSVLNLYGVDCYSMVRLSGGHPELEVLCLPSQSFKVSRPPTQAQSNITTVPPAPDTQRSAPKVPLGCSNRRGAFTALMTCAALLAIVFGVGHGPFGILRLPSVSPLPTNSGRESAKRFLRYVTPCPQSHAECWAGNAPTALNETATVRVLLLPYRQFTKVSQRPTSHSCATRRRQQSSFSIPCMRLAASQPAVG